MPGGDKIDMPDPLIWMAYVAAATKTINLGTGILIVPQRNPAILAKEVATLDVLSGGRVMLGSGSGGSRRSSTRSACRSRTGARASTVTSPTMRALWSDGAGTVDDDFTSFANCVSRPRPTGRSVPIVIGGHSEPAARRAGRLGDGFFPGRGSHEELAHLFDVMRRPPRRPGGILTPSRSLRAAPACSGPTRSARSSS